MDDLLKIGMIEDEEIIYLNWRKAFEDERLRCDFLWFSGFEDYYERRTTIDLLITDRVIISNGFEDDLLLDGHIEKITRLHRGPIILSSGATTPKAFRHHFTKILRDKDPPRDLTHLLTQVLPVDHKYF